MESRFKVFTADIVSSYLGHHEVPATELPRLIAAIHAALKDADREGPPGARQPTPNAAAIRKSVTDNAIISFEDGKPYKMLKRHLAKHGLSPEAYREKWGLPHDYPMVAPSYSQKRSQLARDMGWGEIRKRLATERRRALAR
jgi:predicted transcriptional regulator